MKLSPKILPFYLFNLVCLYGYIYYLVVIKESFILKNNTNYGLIIFQVYLYIIIFIYNNIMCNVVFTNYLDVL